MSLPTRALPSAAPAGTGALPAASAILGMGTCVPDGLLTNADLEAMVDTSDAWIMERTGIRTRHRAGTGETSASMGILAARRALEQAGNPDVDLVLTATCTPDTLVPSTASLIQRGLGLHGQPAMDVNAACSGFVYGMRMADSLVRSGAARTVLLVTSEAMTSLVDYGDRSTCVLFGDGAAATVVGAAPAEGGGLLASNWGADGADAAMIYYGPSQDGQRPEDRLRMAGRGTYRLAVERLCHVAEQLCADAGWTLGDVDHVIPHQANLRIIDAAAKRLGVPSERLVLNVAEMGNTSAASIPIALAEAVANGRISPGDRLLCVAFGAGSTWGGIALTWTAPCGV
ncbi:MAG: beta-ketoacyl-ACP synthase III [Candidatus Dormibacteria bacterium]